MIKRILAILGVMVVLAIIAIALSLYSLHTGHTPQAPSNAPPISPYTLLEQGNKDFTAGQAYQTSGDYDDAIASFQKALADTQDPTQDSVIEYYMAYSYELKGDVANAVKIFKVIASSNNDNGWEVMAAYAVQSMAAMHYGDLSDQSITADIFSDSPYNSFGPSAATTTDEAYRDLFAYAASLYPLGIPESRIAYWYANDLKTTLKGATTSPEGMKDVDIVNDSLDHAQDDVGRAESDPITSSDAPEILSRVGLVEGIMAQMGVGDPAAAEQSFKQALQLSSDQKMMPGNRGAFYYAEFLGMYYGNARASDITATLAPFSVGNSANIVPAMATALTSIRTDQTQKVARGWTITLAQIDPSFKAYLISLGWESSDFSS